MKFRVLVLDAETKPYQSKKLNVNVTDSHGTVVYESDDLNKEFPGVFSDELQISDSPPLGKWKIDVKVDDGHTTTQFFEVSEYVLPRFDANIECPSHVLLSDKKVKVLVYGKYTFGEFVEALATVVATVYDEDKPEISKAQKVKSAKVSGKKNIEFDFFRDLNLNAKGTVKIDVTIEEILTGKKANESKIIVVHEKTSHKVELIRKEIRMKPGFPFALKAVVKKFDESIEMNEENKVEFKVTFYQSRPKTAENLSQLRMNTIGSDVTIEKFNQVELKEGVADYVFDVPKSALGMTVTATYLDAESSVNITRFASQSKEYLRVELVTER